MTHQVNLGSLTPSQRRATSRRFVETILTIATETLELRDFYVEVEFVSDARIKRINAEHRDKDKPTDVLSFPSYEGKNGKLRVPRWDPVPRHLGSIVIATGVAKRQAREFSHSLKQEIIRLLVHGVCHLAGYDHERSLREEKVMFSAEDRILDKVRQTL